MSLPELHSSGQRSFFCGWAFGIPGLLSRPCARGRVLRNDSRQSLQSGWSCGYLFPSCICV